MLLAPRVWFSLLFGFGAMGYLLHHWFSGVLLFAMALAAAWLFERWMVLPVWNFVLRFASSPARTLEGALLDEAVALTNFDAHGQGLISVTLDGQIRQMLATLDTAKADFGARVRPGEKLTIVAIDARRNSCTVSRIGYRAEHTLGTNNT